jgi:serine/threonine protein kinase/WD40 repeat protein
MDNLSGQVIRGYELHELIGEGGFGAVYRATQTVVDREVAIKIILPQYANQPEFIRRFEAEAKTVARLDHLHIVSLFDYWRDPTGAYLVLRFLRGGTVKDLIKEQGALAPPTAARIFSQVAGALATAHRLGVVHRDVKPANILLDTEKNAYLSDFGIAKSSLGDKSVQSKVSSESSLTGSAGYISPEQINLAEVTPRSDIYSMTLVLYEMLTGQHAYPEATTSIALFVKHTNEQLPPLINFPEKINAIIQKGAAKRPEDRYADILEMASDFRNAIVEAGLVNVQSQGGIVHDFDTSSFMKVLGSIGEIVNPYKGLHAFQESDAQDFFGRETLTNEILDKLDDNHPLARFLVVVGPSGSGKSSVVKAGVIPELRKDALPGSEDWYYVEMVPGINPMTELEEALSRVAATPLQNLHERLMSDTKALHQVIKEIVPLASELVIVIDQFEEAFTVGDERVRSHFLQSLYEAVVIEDSRLRVIATLRADFYDRPLSEAKFGQLIQQRTVVVLPLSAEELERAITAPASQVKVFYERGLPSQIVTEVIDQPGVLPMLQYALTELFEKREEQLLTHKAYQELGGVLGALARRAEEIYQGLDDEHQEAVRQLMLRLVTLGEGSEDTRRRALQSEALAAAEDKKVMQAVIDMFSSYRLLTTDRDPATRSPTVEVAHEALIRQWQRLRTWLDETREDVRLQRLLAGEAQEWADSGRDSSFLLRGGRLVQYEEWAKTTTIALTALDKEFIVVSAAERDRIDEEERLRQIREREQERTARQRLQLLLVGAMIAGVIGIALAVLAFQQRSVAETNLVEANAQGTNAAVQQVTAVAAAGTAVAAQGTSDANAQEAIANLDEANAQRERAAVQQAIAETAAAVAVIAQETSVANAAEAVEARSTAVLQVTDVAAAQLTSVANLEIANNESARAATQQSVAEVAAATAVAAQSAAEVAAIESRSLALAGGANDFLGQNSPLALFFAIEANRGIAEEDVSPLAQRVLSLAVFSSPRARLQVGSPVTAVQFLPLPADAAASTSDNAIPAGLQAVSTTEDGRILLWDIQTQTSTEFTGRHNGRVNGMVLNPQNPNMLITVGSDGEGIIWLVDQRAEARRLVSGNSNVPARTVAISDTENPRIAIGYENGRIVVFDTNGSLIRELPEVSVNAVNSITFVPNLDETQNNANDMVIAFDDTTRYWDDNFNGTGIFVPFDLGNVLARLGKVQDVAFGNDSEFVLTSTFTGVIRQRRQDAFGDPEDFVLTSESDVGNRPQLWEIDVNNTDSADDTVSPLRVSYPEHLGQVLSVTFSPNGEFIVSTAADGTAFLSDAAGGQLVRRLLAHDAAVLDAAFDDDGRFILTAGADGDLYLWDVNTNIGNEVPYDGTGDDDVINSSVSQVRFTEDGRIFSGSDRGEVAIWTYENLTPDFVNPLLVESLIPQVVYRLVELGTDTENPTMRLLTGSLDMRYYDVASGTILSSYQRPELRSFVNDIAVTDDGNLAVWAGGYFQRVGDRDVLARDIRIPILALWDTNSGQPVRDFALNNEQPLTATTLPTATPVSTDDTTAQENQAIDNSITAVAISPDNRLLVSGDENGVIIVWDLQTGQQLVELEGHTDIISVLRFNENSGDTTQFQLLSGSADRLIILWEIPIDVSADTLPDIVRGFLKVRFIGHTDLINDVDFNPVQNVDGGDDTDTSNPTIVSGSEDRRVILWDATTGEILQILGEQSSPITTVQFTPEGAGVVFGTLDGRVLFKGVDSPEEIIEWAENNRYILSCEEVGQRGEDTETCGSES